MLYVSFAQPAGLAHLLIEVQMATLTRRMMHWIAGFIFVLN